MLGVEPGASPEEIRAAWRALARRHHPDLTADDPDAARRATRRMAEINAAYAALTRAGETPDSRGRGGAARSASRLAAGGAPEARRRSAASAADAAGDRPPGHHGHVPAAEPGHDAARDADPADRPAAPPV